MHASRTGSAERWLAVGQSGDADARAAGRAAATQALTGEHPKLLVVFCYEAYDLAELVAGIEEAAGDTPWIGCSTAGEISTAGPGDAGVVVTALGGPGFEVATASANAADGRLREAGAEVAACFDRLPDKEHKVLLLLTDGLVGDQSEIVRGAYRVVGAGVPALDVYLDRLGAPLAARVDPQAFIGFALTHPLGLSRRSGEEVRFVAGADFADRSLLCVAHVPQGGLTWFMDGDDASVLEATDAACRDALAPLDDRPPLGLVAFDCIARRGVLGEPGIHTEVDRIASFAGGAPVAGFYTYGEIARTHGISGFHNQTLVVLAVG